MASKKKVTNSLKAEKRSRVILGIIIAVILICVVGFFVYISGVTARILTGVKITQKDANGTDQVIANINVAETNYHFYQVANTYLQYGLVSRDTLDDVVDEESGRTSRMILLDQAANELMNIVLVNRAATEAGYTEHSAASRIADINIDSARMMAELYGYGTADRYLQTMYGRGMDVNTLRDCIERETLTQEYEQYMRQFIFTASEEEIQAAYDANPNVYQRVDYSLYYFAGETDEEGNTDLAPALANAQTVMDNTTDPESFRQAVLDIIGEEDAAIAGFTEDNDPTHYTGETSANTDMRAEGLTDFLFSAENGEMTTLETELGVYVAYLENRYLMDEPTVAYRSLTLTNDVSLADEGTTEADVAAAYQELVARANAMVANPLTSLQFADLVKENSVYNSEIINGGYTDSVTIDRYTATEENPVSDAQVALGQWLFSEDRVQGDTYILTSDSNSSVTIYYFESNIPAWMNTARTTIITGLVNGWSNDLLSGEPDALVAYDLVRYIG